ncbi:MAG: efflux RND transporter periplasmic adaptor subunit [Desulfovibrionaceae bacterium]|nr:efflux RND transporter periplasmic adaptor subunit [Desulfovibrionaceae bacterium]
MPKFRAFVFLLILVAALGLPALAQQQGPPVPVVTAKVESGEVAAQSEYVGTVYFTEMADVASEVDGKIVEAAVEDGQTVAEGDVLVRLSTDILEKEVLAARARLNKAKSEHELARLNDKRVKQLFQSESVAEGEYDAKRLGARGAESGMAEAAAELRRLEIELDKKTIRAPFNGVVTKRDVYRGEWISKGQAVATVARAGEYDVVANVPERVARVVRPGLEVEVKAGGRSLTGKVFAVVPRGEVATRTFPVKIRVLDQGFLAEGMEALVRLPYESASRTLVLPRDAIISVGGQLSVWVVRDGKAQPVPVRVVGYRGLGAGVQAEDLAPGMEVVVKGNERLRPGQAVARAKDGQGS